MTNKTENPDTFLVEYTSRLMIRHLLLIEDHLLEYSREPTSQCLACLWWHLEKLVAYSSLECVKFEGLDTPTCQGLAEWAAQVQGKMEKLDQTGALELAKQAREYRYKMAEISPAEVKESPLLLYLREKAEEAEFEESGKGMPAPFGWVGGKSQLSKTIVPLIPPHKVYVEPFCGAASVFWHKARSDVEVLSDADPDLIRFYENLGNIGHCDIKTLSSQFEELKARQGQLEPCEFLSQLKCSFGTKRDAKAMTSDCNSNAMMFHKRLPKYQERIKGVKLLCEDWANVVKQYDSPDTFFYFDPPYHGTSRGYKYGEDQLLRLAEVLPALKGKWLLSYDDNAEVKEAFSKYSIMPVKSRYTLMAGSNKRYGQQLLIANYPLEAKVAEESKLVEYIKSKEAEMEEKNISIPKKIWEDAALVCMGVAGDSGQREGLRKEAQNVVDYVYGLKEALASEPAEKHPYAHKKPKYIEVFSNVINKHYLDYKAAIIPGSIRTLKQSPDILVYMGCPKNGRWDEASVTCSPNPVVIETIVRRTKKRDDEVKEWEGIGVKVVRRESEMGTEPTDKAQVPRPYQEPEGADLGGTYAQDMVKKYGVPFDPTRLKSIKGFRFGDRVELIAYDESGIPIGAQGTVWAIAGFKGHSISPDPASKLLFVKWDKHGEQSVWITRVKKIGKMRSGDEVAEPSKELEAVKAAIPEAEEVKE